MSKPEFKYLQIADTLRIKILSKIWKPGDMLPSENTLGEDYSVSRMTIRKAIEILINEGYITSTPGKGNYVKEFTINNFEILYTPQYLIKDGFTKAELLHADVMPADIHMVYNLQVAPYTKIVCIQTILYQDTLPVALEIKYIPYFPGMNIEEDSLEYRSLKNTLSGDTLISDWRNEVSITGSFVPKVPSLLSHLEGLHHYIPGFVMVFEEKLMDEDNIPLGYAKLYILSDYCILEGLSIR